MVAAGQSLVLIARPGWHQAIHVSVGDLSVGSRVNGHGRGSCRLPAKNTHTLGFSDLKGCWIAAHLGLFGTWAGIIEDNPATVADGMVELNAVAMGGQIDYRATPRTYRQTSSAAGALIFRALVDSANDDPLWIDEFAIDEDGAPVTIEWRGESLGRVITTLARNGGGVWAFEVGSDRRVTFRYRHRARDRRAYALLAEHYNVVAGSIRPTISGLVNDLTGVANDRNWLRTDPARVESTASILAYGRRQDTRSYDGHTRRSSLEGVVRADLDVLAVPGGTVSLEIPANNAVLREFQHGDLVRLWSNGTNRAYDLTVLGRSYEPARGFVTVTGTALEAA